VSNEVCIFANDKNKMFNLFKSYNTDMKRIFLLMTGVLVMASMSCGKPTNANAMANEEASEVQTEVTADVPTADAAEMTETPLNSINLFCIKHPKFFLIILSAKISNIYLYVIYVKLNKEYWKFLCKKIFENFIDILWLIWYNFYCIYCYIIYYNLLILSDK
jgi:hypothetical protein